MTTSSEMPAAMLLAPLALAAYQDGAVVNRALLKRAGGTITLFGRQNRVDGTTDDW